MKNDYLNKLKEKLYFEIKEIEENKFKKQEIDTKLELLKSLNLQIKDYTIEQIEQSLTFISLQLDTISPNLNIYTNELYKIIALGKKYINDKYFSDEYNNVLESLNKIKDSLIELEFKLDIESQLIAEKYNIEKLTNYRKIISLLKYKQHISTEQLKIISKYYDEINVSDKEQIITFECIKMHNTEIRENYRQKCIFDKRKKYEVIKMLNLGYEIFDKIDVKQNIQTRINTDVFTIMNSYENYCKISEQIDVKPLFLNINNNYSDIELKAFYHTLMNNIQNKIYDQIETMQDKEFYLDKAIKTEILKEYKNLLEFYRQTRLYYDNLIKEKNTIKEETLKLEVKEINENKNHLFFLKRNENSTYFEKDLGSIPKEYLETVIHLLKGKLNNTLAREEDKSLKGNNKYKGLLELKKDQVRILYNHVKDNNYAIIGIGTKKADIDYALYDSMSIREKLNEQNIKTYSLDEEEVYSKIIKCCEENKRKKVR